MKLKKHGFIIKHQFKTYRTKFTKLFIYRYNKYFQYFFSFKDIYNLNEMKYLNKNIIILKTLK